jgi:DNA-binding CsgD family transcriptional regulator
MEVLRLRLIGLTLNEVAARFGVTSEVARRALRMLGLSGKRRCSAA